MNASELAIAAAWSYGLAAAGYAIFAIRLAIGWRRSTRASLLIAATIAMALWAASTVAALLWAFPFAPLTANAFDALRYAAWFAFAAYLLKGRAMDQPGAAVAAPPIPHWATAFVAAGLVASLTLSVGYLPFRMSPAQGRMTEYAFRLGLAIFGLILVEQLLRRALPHARWGLKPLCVGLAGVFAFDIFFYSEAMLFGVLDANIFVARGIANALIIPFIAITATPAIPAGRSNCTCRGASYSTPRRFSCSGFFIIRMTAAG